MCVPLAAAAIATTVAAGGFTAYSQYQSGAASNKYYQYMSDQSRQEGQLALKQGEAQSTAIQEQAKLQGKQLSTNQSEFNASQRAAMAAAGVTGVTAEDIVSSTFNKENLDKSLLRYNADLKSYESTSNAAYRNWASNVQADQLTYQGKAAKYAGKTQAFSTLLATAASVATIGAFSGLGAAKTAGTAGSFSPGTLAGSYGPSGPQGYSSLLAARACWVAAEVLANGNMYDEKVCKVRNFVLNISPKWFKNMYIKYGLEFSKVVKNNLLLKISLRPLFEIFAKIGSV